jgi:gamma-glutamyltranspeptidase/glutathione hydrolase
LSTKRSVVVGSHGMVSAGHSLAAAAALDVLQHGGNAVDAALAAAAVQCVVEMPWCSLGGDAFMLVYTPADGVVAFNGSGAAPGGLHKSLIAGPKVPRIGPLSVGVPGLVATWQTVAQRYATRPLHQLFEPAIGYARHGFPVYPRLERALTKLTDYATPLGELVQKNGRITGELFHQEKLAETLEAIGTDGAASFYSGRIGQALVDFVKERGGVLTLEDLSHLRVAAVSPISTTYRSRQIVSHPPVSLGCVLLQELTILDGFPVHHLQPRSPELIDLQVRCKQAAFADAASLGDPDETDNRLDWLLSDERAAYWRERIADQAATPQPVAVAGGSDTTSTVVADGNGDVVCLIQSLFNEFGSRELVPECGVLLNDRLANLSVDDRLPNGVKGGRRPLHTLNTYMVLEHDTPILAGATPGGRGQVQTNLQVLVNVLDFGMDVQTAVDAPRWISGLPYRGENDQTLYLEPEVSPQTAEALQRAGHIVQHGIEAGDQADPFGNCTVIARSHGTFQGAADARRDAFAIGW